MGGSLRHFGPVNQGWLSCQGKCFCQTACHWAGWGINRETNRVPSYRWTDETTTVIPMALTHADLVLHCDCDNAESRALIDKTPPLSKISPKARPVVRIACPRNGTSVLHRNLCHFCSLGPFCEAYQEIYSRASQIGFTDRLHRSP